MVPEEEEQSCPVLPWISAGLGVRLFNLAMLGHFALKEMKQNIRKGDEAAKNRLLLFPSGFLVASNRNQLWLSEAERECIKKILSSYQKWKKGWFNQVQGHAHHIQNSTRTSCHHVSVPESKIHTFKAASSSRQRTVPLTPLSLRP